MSDRPLIVYLDSSDFSVMSDPKRQHEWEAEREALARYVAQGDIRCVFSQAHLVEMAPLDRSRAGLAVHKVDLLVSLCGGFTLPSLDRLLSGELMALREERPRIHDVIADDGKWYPPIDDIIANAGTKLFTSEEISNAIAQYAGDRVQRRAAQRKLLKKGASLSGLLSKLKAEDLGDAALKVQKTYPMRNEDARTLVRYMRGQASGTDAQRAFESSLRDPRFMMRWFASENTDVTQFTSWLRDSSLKLKTVVEDFAALAKLIRELPEDQRTHVAPKTILAKDQWNHRADALTARVAQRLADEFLSPPTLLQFEHLHQTCAGLSTMLRTFFDAAWTSTTEQPRAPSSSDLGDSYHAMYSPYVDIFRPDSFMAPHIARHATRFGTQVVPKLRQLVPAIEARISERRLAGDAATT